MINTYCAGCHNSKLPTPAAGLGLDAMNVNAPYEHPEVWEKAFQRFSGL